LPELNAKQGIKTREDLSGQVTLDAMARLFPPSSHPHLFLDLSNRACSECVVDCDDDACMTEIDDRCTDQCVIVPCDDPEHGDVQCPEGKCESTCAIPESCPLVSASLYNFLTTSDVAFQPGHAPAPCETLQYTGISCPQDGCGLACGSTCDDPDSCSFVNAVSARYPKARCSPILTLLSRPSSFIHKAPESPLSILTHLILTQAIGTRRSTPSYAPVESKLKTTLHLTISYETLMRGPLRLFPP